MFKIKLIGIWFYRILFSKSHMKVNILDKIYYAFLGFKEDQITLYNLNKNNKKEYISEFEWHKSRKINGKYSYVLNNKVVSTNILKEFIKVPEIYFIKENGKMNKTYEDVLTLLKNKKTMFYKPISKGQGNGIKKIEFINKNILINGKETCKKDFIQMLNKNNNYFITETIKQSKYCDSLFDKTYNTLRIITIRDYKTQQFKINFIVQRIGTNDTIPVDNGSKGGLISKVDLKTGILSTAKCLYNINNYDVHPDTNNHIKGLVVPNFELLKEQILEVSNKFSYLNFIAWDVLPTEDGFCVIEANTSSGINILQVFGGVRNKELGNFYRYHKIIK